MKNKKSIWKNKTFKENFEYACGFIDKLNDNLNKLNENGMSYFVFYDDEIVMVPEDNKKFLCKEGSGFGIQDKNTFIIYIGIEWYDDGKLYFPSKKKIDKEISKFKIIEYSLEDKVPLLNCGD